MIRNFLLLFALISTSPIVFCAEIVTKAVETGNITNRIVTVTWFSNDRSSDDLPHGCNKTQCYYLPLTQYSLKGVRYYANASNAYNYFVVDGTKDTTWKSVSAKFKEYYGTSGVFNSTWTNYNITLDCAVFGISDYPISQSGGFPISYASTQPGNVCAPVIVSNTCQLYDEHIMLEHKELIPSEIEGHEAIGKLSISCSAPLPVKITSSPANDLILKSGEISNHLTIGDKELNSTINLDDGINELTIKSKLHVEKNITPGSFAGSQTLIMTVQ
ncbi:hypothetical protein ACLEX4_14765 [Pseudescherichia vulneris]